jgi:hypothetical protein
MNADKTLWIGKDHTICEDYAMAGVTKDNVAYAFVSDGCSASTDVDFGARLLLFATKEGIDSDYQWEQGKVGELAIYNTRNAAQLFFPSLAARVENNNLNAYMYGDGVIVHKKKLSTDIIHIELTSGAPDYLSYQLDPARMELYKKEFADSKKVVWTNYDGIHDYEPFTPFVLQRDVEEGDVISVISDGINSFRKADYTPIPWQDLIEEFTGFKNFEGEFVQRRIGAFKRKCLKEGITHSDDISIASIIV